jgi:hypothetical protein
MTLRIRSVSNLRLVYGHQYAFDVGFPKYLLTLEARESRVLGYPSC